MIDLSVIIVNWNTRDLLAQCLDSVFRTADGLDLEVFVIDNASGDGSPDMVRSNFPRVRLIENQENVGFARANNQAISVSKGRYVLLLNSDTVATTQSLQKMIAFMERHPDVGVMGPELVDAGGDIQPSWAVFPSLLSELLGYHKRTRTPLTDKGVYVGAFEVDWLAGACLLVRREPIDLVGLLDERFFLYSEETDWCRRIKAASWRVVYLPEARVVHLEGMSSSQVSQQALFLLYQSKILYARKHFGLLSGKLLQLGLLLRFFVVSCIRWLQGHREAAVSRWSLLKRLWNT